MFEDIAAIIHTTFVEKLANTPCISYSIGLRLYLPSCSNERMATFITEMRNANQFSATVQDGLVFDAVCSNINIILENKDFQRAAKRIVGFNVITVQVNNTPIDIMVERYHWDNIDDLLLDHYLWTDLNELTSQLSQQQCLLFEQQLLTECNYCNEWLAKDITAAIESNNTSSLEYDFGYYDISKAQEGLERRKSYTKDLEDKIATLKKCIVTNA